MSEPILILDGVVAGYGKMTILNGTTARVNRGAITTVIGPNGAGKSTLFKTIFGLLPARAGTIALDGTGRSPGRGAYVCRDVACMTRALDKGGLGRALSTRLPADVQAALTAAIETTQPTTTITLNTDQGGARGQE